MIERLTLVRCDLCREPFAGPEELEAREQGKAQRAMFAERGWKHSDTLDFCGDCWAAMCATGKRPAAAFAELQEEGRP